MLIPKVEFVRILKPFSLYSANSAYFGYYPSATDRKKYRNKLDRNETEQFPLSHWSLSKAFCLKQRNKEAQAQQRNKTGKYRNKEALN